ncbi:hypothetical protein TNCV_1309441 [Trichonephila clavipes]|nr:hypothetical protein TNCV_1309441 [Trichonephila clavipes]
MGGWEVGTGMDSRSNEIFQQFNTLHQKFEILLQWFDKYADDFQLMSWPHNLPDISPIKHFLGLPAIEWQLRALKYHRLRISKNSITTV